jgi:hypothetical protein
MMVLHVDFSTRGLVKGNHVCGSRNIPSAYNSITRSILSTVIYTLSGLSQGGLGGLLSGNVRMAMVV